MTTENNLKHVVNNFTLLERFLATNTVGGETLDISNVNEDYSEVPPGILSLIKYDPLRVADTAARMSVQGRCLKNNAALFILAAVMANAGTPYVAHHVRKLVNEVARTGTDILLFADHINTLKGWGSGTRKAVSGWYTSKTVDNLAFQFMKYKQREGWAHRDVLRLAHPVAPSQEMNELFRFMVNYHHPKVELSELIEKTLKEATLPKVVLEALELTKATKPSQVVAAIARANLPREVIPDNFLSYGEVWEALLPNMGPTALLRNLNRMTNADLLHSGSPSEKIVLEKLDNIRSMRNNRIHPIALLTALKTYSMGRGLRGSTTWKPQPGIVKALDQATQDSFDNVEPTGKRFLLGVDISGSMAGLANNSVLTSAEISASMALITMKHEPDSIIMGFDHSFRPLPIKPNHTLREAMAIVVNSTFGTTNCAAPMQFAENTNSKFDVFCIYTDNDTNTSEPPANALRRYRDKSGIEDAKMIVSASRTSRFSIADPTDSKMLDILGFDGGTPAIISNFVTF